MSNVIVDVTIGRASVLLLDPDNTRWSKDELLGWLNDGQREAVLRKPSVYVKNTTVPLVAGARQELPVDAIEMVDIVRNVDGDAITPVMRASLDAQMRGWYRMTPTKDVLHYCYAKPDVKHFYVYPPNTGTGAVEAIYSASPPPAVLGGPSSLDDVYQAALLDYVMYRAYSKDSEYTGDAALVNLHYSAFMSALGVTAPAAIPQGGAA